METERRQTIEYKFLRQNTHHAVPRMRYTFSIYLTIFHVSFVVLMAFFAKYKLDPKVSYNGNGNGNGNIDASRSYSS